MKQSLISIVTVVTLLFGVGALALPAPAFAASPTQAAKDEACAGITGQTGGSCGSGGTDIQKVMKAVLNILSLIAGVTAVIMIIISGMKYITSQGEAQSVSSAKRTLIYAIVGLVVVAFSQILVHLVLFKATKP